MNDQELAQQELTRSLRKLTDYVDALLKELAELEKRVTGLEREAVSAG